MYCRWRAMAPLEVMRWAGEELGWLAVSVARQIGMENDAVEIIQAGSVFDAGALITEPMQALVLQHCPKAQLKRLDGPPVVGAVMLGMEVAGFDGYAVQDVIGRYVRVHAFEREQVLGAHAASASWGLMPR